MARVLQARLPQARLILLPAFPAARPLHEPDLFDAVLTKPVRQERLFEVMAGLLESGPTTAPATARTVSAFDLPAPTRRMSILIVEDTPVNQKVAQHLLARFGFRSDVAASGFEALRALDQRSLDAEAAAKVLGKRAGAVRTAAYRGLRNLAKQLAAPAPAPEKTSVSGVTRTPSHALREVR